MLERYKNFFNFKKDKRKDLAIILGNSYAGKDFLVRSLTLNYEGYNHLQQVTTRSRRKEEIENFCNYLFINDKIYKRLDKGKLLFGRIKKKSFNGNNYGTFNLLKDDKINICILNEEGIEDFFKNFYSEKKYNVIIFILKTDLNILEKRQHSLVGTSFGEKERQNRDLKKELNSLNRIEESFSAFSVIIDLNLAKPFVNTSEANKIIREELKMREIFYKK